MTYKIRTFANGANRRGEAYLTHSLTVPAKLARELPENVSFSCELTEAGILYRPVLNPRRELPRWVTR